MNIYRFIKYYLIYLPAFTIWNKKYRKSAFSLKGSIYDSEIQKHKDFLKATKDKLFFKRVRNWFCCDIKLISDAIFKNFDLPTAILIVHNELDKTKLFFQHHKKIGIDNFIVIANNPTKELLDWLCQQKNTKVYTVDSKYTSYYKSAWVQKVLAIHGYNNWYLVLDCDELFDLPRHNLKHLINDLESKKIYRPWGYLVDFYSQDKLYDTNCKWDEISKKLNYFDKDSYKMYEYCEPFTRQNLNAIWGGFRQRCFNIEILLSKEALFKFNKNDIYENHYLFPLTNTKGRNCSYILRHYKFLKNDYEEFVLRAKTKNFSLKGKKYIKYTDEKNNWCPTYEGSVKYSGGKSLECLPYLEQ